MNTVLLVLVPLRRQYYSAVTAGVMRGQVKFEGELNITIVTCMRLNVYTITNVAAIFDAAMNYI